jgi:hypothetical protein
MKNIVVSFDNEYGMSVKELIKILRRKKYQGGEVKVEVTKHGLAIVRIEPAADEELKITKQNAAPK